MKEILAKIQGDFFSVMAPGFYLLIVLGTFILSMLEISGYGTYKELGEIMSSTEKYNDYWPLYLLIIFLSYLFGHFLRAIPVGLAEKFCKNFKIFAISGDRVRGNSFDSIYYSKTSLFPYHTALEKIFESLGNSGYPKNIFCLPKEDTIHTFFNYMKSVLCAESPSSFSYTQSLENRVRLFSGMFWSTSIGVLLFLILEIMHLLTYGVSFKSPFHIILAISSGLICILLGSQLPRIRGQEVEYVFHSYLSYIRKLSNSQFSTSTTNPPLQPTASRCVNSPLDSKSIDEEA